MKITYTHNRHCKKEYNAIQREAITAKLVFILMLFATIFVFNSRVDAFLPEPIEQPLVFNPDLRLDRIKFQMNVNNRDKIIDYSTDFIAGYEKFYAECYWDVSGYTQGYGHKCIGDAISEHASKNILKKEVERLYDLLPPLSFGEYVGIISFLYNHPVNQNAYIDMIWSDWDSFVSDVEYKANNHVWINGVRYGGLLVRRKAEWEYISLKN